MIVTENKQAVIAAWNKTGPTPATLALMAAACMMEARAHIVTQCTPITINYAAIEASTDQQFVNTEFARIDRLFLSLLNDQPSFVFEQIVALPEFNHE